MTEPNGVRALVVDDTVVNRTVLVSQLQRFGIEATTCANGAEALAALDQAQLDEMPFDVVLMDWHMPELDGLEALVLHRTRAFEHDLEPTPIIMVTADASDESRQRCLDAGAIDFLAKPVNLATLRGSVAAVLGDHRLLPDPTTPSATTTSARLVNRSVIDQLVDDLGGTDSVSQVIEAFVTDADQRLAAVTDGQAGGDLAEARRASHTLKSTAALLGASELSAAAKRFEQQFDAGERPTKDELASFEALFQATLTDLNTIRDSFSDAIAAPASRSGQ